MTVDEALAVCRSFLDGVVIFICTTQVSLIKKCKKLSNRNVVYKRILHLLWLQTKIAKTSIQAIHDKATNHVCSVIQDVLLIRKSIKLIIKRKRLILKIYLNKLGLNWAKLSSNWNWNTLIKVCCIILMITNYHYKSLSTISL